jgi:UPF0755 protein
MKKAVITLILFTILATFTVASLLYREYKQRREREKPAPIVYAEEISVTLIEGWTLKDIGEYLEKYELAATEDFIKFAGEFDLRKYPTAANSIPKSASPEGFVFPDTYRIPKIEKSATSSQAVSEAVLRRALQNFENKFTPEMEGQAKKLGMTVYEVVTLASIIEKETGRNAVTKEQKERLNEERFVVSGIFHNRLKINMALESDATVNYITGKNDPAASLKDIEANSPYNTYRNRGLPPGPIANPSLSSIMAALYPKDTDYMYFLHKQPSGEVVYSKTFEEHVQNKFRYLK